MAGRAQDIRSFFQAPPVRPTPLAQQTPPPTEPRAGPPGDTFSLSSALGSSNDEAPSSPDPKLATPPGRPRDAVIQDSDSDDDSSDDSLVDVDTLWRRVNPAAAAAAKRDPCVTPKAKRVAHHTPLSIRTKRTQEAHKYDMSALLRLNEADIAAEERRKRLEALFSAQDDLSADRVVDANDALEGQLAGYAGDEDEDGAGAGVQEKIRRAIKRTDITATRKCWYFFQQNFDPDAQPPEPFPTKKADGVWKCLRDAKARRQHFLFGMPLQMISHGFVPGKEVLEWILYQVSREEDKKLREQYIATVCESRTQPLGCVVDSECLRNLFRSLGALEDSLVDLSSKLKFVPQRQDAFPEKNRGLLISILQLVTALFGSRFPADPGSPAIGYETTIFITKILLRLGVDTLVIENADVFEGYEDALASVAGSVQDDKWNQYCFDAGACLLSAVEGAFLRCQVLSCISPTTTRLHDFRRRLAIASFFDKPELAKQKPEEATSMRAVTNRVGSRAFSIGAQTDYHQLTGMLSLLDVVVDDGLGRGEKRFDEEVDELCGLVRRIHVGIQATGGSHSSRLDAKSLAQWIPDRLTHAVRTKSARKPNIFDGIMKHDDDDDGDIVPRFKQQTLKPFFKKSNEAMVKFHDS